MIDDCAASGINFMGGSHQIEKKIYDMLLSEYSRLQYTIYYIIIILYQKITEKWKYELFLVRVFKQYSSIFSILPPFLLFPYFPKFL